MDTSETYIRMCKQAEEIQTLKVQYFQEHGNFFGDSVTPRPTWLISCDICFDLVTAEKNTPGRFIFLPRQEQLQEMVLPDPDRKDAWGDPMPPDPKVDSVFWLFHDFTDKIQERKRSQQTGEQLWLRYVMKEEYGKTWDGEAWVK